MNPRNQVSGWGVGVGAAYGRQAPRGKAMSQADGISSVSSWRASADVKQRVARGALSATSSRSRSARSRSARSASPRR